MSKILTSIWACVAVLTLLIGIRIIDPDPIERTRLISFDAKINSIPETQSDQIVLLNIGEKALEVNGQWPWPRQYFAQMISDLRNANAGIIGITVMYPEADRFGGDEVFTSWVKDNGIVLSQVPSARGRSDVAPYVGTAVLGEGDPYDFAENFYKNDGTFWDYPFVEPNDEALPAGLKTFWFLKNAYPEEFGHPNSFARMVNGNSLLMDHNKLSGDGRYGTFGKDYSYHLDATKFAHWLKDNVCHNVKHKVCNVTGYCPSKKGIDALITNKGKVKGDLFIDCTGFKSLLLEQYMGVGFKSYENIPVSYTHLTLPTKRIV